MEKARRFTRDDLSRSAQKKREMSKQVQQVDDILTNDVDAIFILFFQLTT
jgi:ABC-type sugar transport system substrate-binding protein